MKLSAPIPTRRQAFTVPEILTAMAVFTVLIAATVSSQIFGLRMSTISEAKLQSSDSARTALNHVRDEIRSATFLFVGNGDAGSFKLLTNNAPRVGNALRIYPTADTNNYVCYYLDLSNDSLMRAVTIGKQLGDAEIVSRNITNRFIFQAEDFQGNVLTNNSNHRIIRMNLDFYKLEYSSASGGKGNVYDFYRMQTRFTRRAL